MKRLQKIASYLYWSYAGFLLIFSYYIYHVRGSLDEDILKAIVAFFIAAAAVATLGFLLLVAFRTQPGARKNEPRRPK